MIWKNLNPEVLMRRYVEGATWVMLAEDYDCHWQTARKHAIGLLSPEFLEAVEFEHRHAHGLGMETNFKPGHHSRTEYKPGQIRGSAARRYAPVGTIRLWTSRTRQGRVPRYYVMKVDDEPNAAARNWKALAIVNWEKAHGPLPEGWSVIHKDGNNLNDQLENLQAIPRSERLRHARSLKPKRFCGKYLSNAIKRTWRDRKLVRARFEALCVATEMCSRAP